MEESNTYFIADIAANHDGELSRALDLIGLAADSGADAAKFQHFKAKDIVDKYAFEKLDLSSHQSNWKKSVYEVYDEASINNQWTKKLKEECEKHNIDFLSTPYDIDYVNQLDKYMKYYKIGSGDITYHEILKKIASKQKKVLLATGASELGEVINAVNTIKIYTNDIVLMQCNTNYTGSKENFKYINLNVLKTYNTLFPDIELGLSDHTPGDTTVLGAISLGAKYIEKHFTDDNNREGPDHGFSMNPKTWRQMVERSQELSYALGSSIKKTEDNEIETRVLQRRALRYKDDYQKGLVFDKEQITYVRPCPPFGITDEYIDGFIGKKLSRQVKAGELIKLSDYG